MLLDIKMVYETAFGGIIDGDDGGHRNNINSFEYAHNCRNFLPPRQKIKWRVELNDHDKEIIFPQFDQRFPFKCCNKKCIFRLPI